MTPVHVKLINQTNIRDREKERNLDNCLVILSQERYIHKKHIRVYVKKEKERERERYIVA